MTATAASIAYNSFKGNTNPLDCMTGLISLTLHTKECLRCRGMRMIPRVDSVKCPRCKGTGKVDFVVRFTTHADTPQREHVDISFEDLVALIGPDQVQDMIARAEAGDPYTAYWDASISHYASLMEVQL
jgi:hypothetical protein